MIPRDFITEWRAHAPWTQDLQVEQDLVISRALVELFSKPALVESLAFRGGTALYKLHIRPAARYSEDIDLVQTRPEPIGATLDAIREALDPWLGTPQRKVKAGSAAVLYRFSSEDAPLCRFASRSRSTPESTSLSSHSDAPLSRSRHAGLAGKR